MIDNEIIELDIFTIKPTDEIGGCIKNVVESFNEKIKGLSLDKKWMKQYSTYYGRDSNSYGSDTIGLQRIGVNGELLSITINHLRAIIQSIIGTISSNPPSFDVIANNTDSSSSQLSSLCKNLIDYYLKYQKINQKLQRAVEQAYILDAGYILLEWDSMVSAAMTGRNENNLFDGEIVVSNPDIFDVYYDMYASNFEDIDWVIVRQWHNKASLIKRFPELSSNIIESSTKQQVMDHDGINCSSILHKSNSGSGEINNQILTYKFFHKRADELPEGRYVWILDDGTVLMESELPYDRVPLERFVVSEMTGTTFGRSPIEDLVPLQEALNLLNSTVLSNQYTTGLQIIACEEGSNLSPSDLGNGITIIKYPNGSHPPSGVNLTATAPEIFNYINKLEMDMNSILGVSSVSRGQGSNASSGSALALQASMTAQNISPIIQNYEYFTSMVMTCLLKILRTYGINNRTISILGKSKSKQVLFNQDDLKYFDRVSVIPANPLSSTVAGRLQIAQQLLSSGMITGGDYIQVLTTGNLDNATDSIKDMESYILSENEALIDGNNTIEALILDNHQRHIDVHLHILNDPKYRLYVIDKGQGNIIQNVMAHIKQHMDLEAAQNKPIQPQPNMPDMGGPGNAKQTSPIAGDSVGNAPTAVSEGVISSSNPGAIQASKSGVRLSAPATSPI